MTLVAKSSAWRRLCVRPGRFADACASADGNARRLCVGFGPVLARFRRLSVAFRTALVHGASPLRRFASRGSRAARLQTDASALEIIGLEASIREEDERVGYCRIAPLVLTYFNLAMDADSTLISRRDLLTVDLRGMKAALFATARARGFSPSDFVRRTLAEAIDPSAASVTTRLSVQRRDEARVRLSLRMSRGDALATLAAARRRGMAPGAYVAGLAAGIPALTGAGSRDEHLDVLVSSNAELTTLGRQLRQLNGLLRQGSVDALEECRETVDRLGQGLRGHLEAVSAVLRDLRPRPRVTAPIHQPPF